MTRRFQFSLKWLFVAMLVVAVACAVWIKFHPIAKTWAVLAGLWFLVVVTAMALLWVASKVTRMRL